MLPKDPMVPQDSCGVFYKFKCADGDGDSNETFVGEA